MKNYYYKVLMEGINDLVFVMRIEDHRFIYELINQAAMKETGLSKDVLGKFFDQVWPQEKAVHLNNQYKKVLAHLKIIQYEDTFISRNGEIIHAETTLTPLFNEKKQCTHIVAVTKNITIEKQAKIQIKQSIEKHRENEERFRIIAENSYDVIKLIDSRGKIIYISPSCKRVLGFSHKEYVGKIFIHHVLPEDRPILEKTILTSIKDKQLCKLQYRQVHKTKGWIWSELRGTPVYDNDGNFRHMVLMTMDITLQKKYEEKMNHFAYHDSLTGLPNRRMLNKRLVEELNKKDQANIGVMMLDIDHFKSINDHFGHDIGDEVIEEFAKRLRETVHQNELVIRLGGDEFVIVLTHINSIDDVIHVAKQIQEAIKMPWQIKNHTLNITTSIGITISPQKGTTKYSLLKHADLALYQAKSSGRNSYQVMEFDQEKKSSSLK